MPAISDADIAGLYRLEDFGLEASYQRAAGGDAFTIRVRFSNRSQRIEGLDFRERIAMTPAASLTDPKQGDSVTIAGQSYRVVRAVQPDSNPWEWQLELSPS